MTDLDKLFHHIRGSLTVIKSDIYLLSNEESSFDLSSSQNALSSVSKSLKNFEIVSKFDEGGFSQSESFFVLQDSIEAVISKLGSELGSRINFVDNAIPYVIYTDNGYLKHLVTGLIENALKFSKDEIEVSVVRGLDKRFLLSVKNKCKSLTHEEIKKLGKPYFTIERDKKSGASGLGLGLASVKSICEYNNWKYVKEYENGYFVSKVVF